MGLYINGIKYNILSPEGLLNMNVNPYHIVTNGVRLLSSDDYILQDIDGLYLTVLETALEYIQSLSSDGNILTDIENKYLTIKKG